jgi:hypothetical protein
LVKAPATVVSGIGRVEQEVNLARTGGILDPIRTADELAGARFHSETIESGLLESRLCSFSKIRRNGKAARLECALEGGLELSRTIGSIEFAARYTNPGPAAGCTCPYVGGNTAIRTERKADEIAARTCAPRQNAGAFRPIVRLGAMRGRRLTDRRSLSVLLLPRRAFQLPTGATGIS